MAETFVQIEIPRTGQKIRNVNVTLPQVDGTMATVLMQVVSIADSQGNVLDLDTASQLNDLIMVMKEVRGLLKLMIYPLTHSVIPREGLDKL